MVSAAAGLWLLARPDRSDAGADQLQRVERLVRDDAEFATAVGAGQQFAHASQVLADDGDECLDHGDEPARCSVRFEAAAYLRTLAVAVLRCTRPAIFDARRAVLGYLEAVAAFDLSAGSRAAAATAPRTPRLPAC